MFFGSIITGRCCMFIFPRNDEKNSSPSLKSLGRSSNICLMHINCLENDFSIICLYETFCVSNCQYSFPPVSMNGNSTHLTLAVYLFYFTSEICWSMILNLPAGPCQIQVDWHWKQMNGEINKPLCLRHTLQRRI